MQSVSLGTDPHYQQQSSYFSPLQALKVLTSHPMQTKTHDNSYIFDWI